MLIHQGTPLVDNSMQPALLASRPGQQIPEGQCRVLIVDDDEIVRAQLRRLLKRAHFDVHVASSAHEALHVLGRLNFQIVLTDLQMPDMDGLDLCRRIRRGFVNAFIYIVVLTVLGSKDDMLLSLVAGADDHVVKNSSNEEILSHMEIARHVSHSSRRHKSPAIL